MTPIEAINKEFNNRFIINTYYDERTMAPIYDIIDKYTNKGTQIGITLDCPQSTMLTDEAIYNILLETINNIISLNRNINIESILKQ